MNWQDEGIVISVRKFSEHAGMIRIFSEQHGLYGGISRAAFSKNSRGLFQPGNRVQARWNARLSEHAGSWTAELLTPVAALIMDNALCLLALSSACTLLEQALHEREPHPELYQRFSGFIQALHTGQPWQRHYVLLELDILSYCGFGLDLAHCAATGVSEDLAYVSPKSGRAVSLTAGEPYAGRLFPLPRFMRESGGFSGFEPQEVLDGMALTGYFLESRLFAPRNFQLPAIRERLLKAMTTSQADSKYGSKRLAYET